jgi:hypothetical protein
LKIRSQRWADKVDELLGRNLSGAFSRWSIASYRTVGLELFT